MRAMMLFSLHRINGDEDETGNSLQLWDILIPHFSYYIISYLVKHTLFKDLYLNDSPLVSY